MRKFFYKIIMLTMIRKILFLTIFLPLSLANGDIYLTNLLGLNNLVEDAGTELKAAISQAEGVLFSFRKRTNEDVKERLQQVDKMIGDVVDDINALENKTAEDISAILDDATLKVNKLEQKFMEELSHKIQEVECVGKRISLQDIEGALGSFGDLIGTHRIKISAPLLGVENKECLFHCDTNEKDFEIKEPFNITYNEIKNFMLDRLKKSDGNTPVNSIITTYEYLADLSLRASCLAPTSADRLRTDYVKFYMKSFHWKNLFGTNIGME